MAEKTLKTRLQMKNDTEANWNKAVNFVPKKGEIIVYNVDDEHDVQRLKIGNGIDNVIMLPFLNKDLAAVTDLEDYAKKDELAEVATSGSFADLTGTEDVATKNYVDEQINAAEIGGVNLIPHSLPSSDQKWWHPNDPAIKNVPGFQLNVVDADELVGKKCFEFVYPGASSQVSVGVYRDIRDSDLAKFIASQPVGTKFTLSFRAKTASANDTPLIRVSVGESLAHYVNVSNEWKTYSGTFEVPKSVGLRYITIYVNGPVTEAQSVYVGDVQLEQGEKATTWSRSPLDVQDDISRRTAVTYDYGGRNLKEVFGTPEALHTALAAEDYTNIAVGDYWPITLNGTFWDYGSYTIPPGAHIYADSDFKYPSGVDGFNIDNFLEATYYSDSAVKYTKPDGGERYSPVSECLSYFERSCTNVVVNLEVAGINHYWRYGNSGNITGKKPHIVFISKDCFPFPMRMRKANNKWEDETKQNPWLGSALFKTLNDESHGVFSLVTTTDIGTYIYSGEHNVGMNAMLETKAPNAENATDKTWNDRGKLFLPSVSEVWGQSLWAEMNSECGLSNQFAIFRDSFRHIIKGQGNEGGRAAWWHSSSVTGSNINFAVASASGTCSYGAANRSFYVPICFIFA